MSQAETNSATSPPPPPQNQNQKNLFRPIQVGPLALTHRIVLPPLTRLRPSASHVPTPMMAEYYAQRASIPGTLLIAEGTLVAPKAGGMDYAPGVWSDEQVEGWKAVVEAVHSQGSYIFLQLFATGRVADPAILATPDSPINPGGSYPLVGASPIPLSSTANTNTNITPRELTHEEILEYISLFRQASHNAVHRAGFDGVEIDCAHGFLLDQFLDDRANRRTDQWGGRRIENRIRFPFEVIKEVASAIGEERTGFRLSPFSTFMDMRMDHPYPTFAVFAARVREAFPRLAFLHVVEPRLAAAEDRIPLEGESNDFLRAIWKGPDSAQNGSVYITAGGYTPDTAIEHAENTDELVAFGRYFISNPDLPARIKKGIPLTPYDRRTFYTPGKAEGYIDYPFADPETRTSYEEKRKGLEKHGISVRN